MNFIYFIILSISIKVPTIICKLDSNGSLNGIFRKLHENYSPLEISGVIELTASSVRTGWDMKNIFFIDNKGYHTGNSGPNQYLQFNFKENLISISSYSIKSRTDSSQSKSWKVNASTNGINWITIHEVIEDLEMCISGKTKSFFINNQSHFKFIRFISTTSRCGDTIYLNFLVIEFFGSLNYFPIFSSNNNNKIQINLFLIINLYFLLF